MIPLPGSVYSINIMSEKCRPDIGSSNIGSFDDHVRLGQMILELAPQMIVEKPVGGTQEAPILNNQLTNGLGYRR